MSAPSFPCIIQLLLLTFTLSALRNTGGDHEVLTRDHTCILFLSQTKYNLPKFTVIHVTGSKINMEVSHFAAGVSYANLCADTDIKKRTNDVM